VSLREQLETELAAAEDRLAFAEKVARAAPEASKRGPAIGSRWQVRAARFQHVYEFMGRDEDGDYRMRLDGLTPESERAGAVLGGEMRVELAWFELRGVEVAS
jgi:hypothetical protein